jgi:hypothetical protein
MTVFWTIALGTNYLLHGLLCTNASFNEIDGIHQFFKKKNYVRHVGSKILTTFEVDKKICALFNIYIVMFNKH